MQDALAHEVKEEDKQQAIEEISTQITTEGTEGQQYNFTDNEKIFPKDYLDEFNKVFPTINDPTERSKISRTSHHTV